MTKVDLSALPLSDAEVTGVTIGRDQVRVALELWDETELVLELCDVSGVEAFAPVGEPLSHADETASDPFLDRSCGISGEESSHYWVYQLWSAVSGEPVLRIVAASVRVVSQEG